MSAWDFGKGFLVCERRLIKRVFDSSVMSGCVVWSCSCHLGMVSGAKVIVRAIEAERYLNLGF